MSSDKAYRSIHDAEQFCDDAHYIFKDYMRKIGQAALQDRQTANNQVAHDLEQSRYVTTFINKCEDLAKRNPDTGKPIPYASGYRSDEDGESCYAWAVFNIADLPSDIDVEGDYKDGEEDLAYQLTGWTRHYNGAGRSFSSEPYYDKSRTRILVKQFRGLDI